jgi:hypothetical protein
VQVGNLHIQQRQAWFTAGYQPAATWAEIVLPKYVQVGNLHMQQRQAQFTAGYQPAATWAEIVLP